MIEITIEMIDDDQDFSKILVVLGLRNSGGREEGAGEKSWYPYLLM
jgi:hypothetical protein